VAGIDPETFTVNISTNLAALRIITAPCILSGHDEEEYMVVC
jgi:hypothetical protein